MALLGNPGSTPELANKLYITNEYMLLGCKMEGSLLV
jgi:hypothetical protein